jgi:hypothetical protein
MDSDDEPKPTVHVAPRRYRISQAMLRVLPNHWGKILVTWTVLTAGLGFLIYLRVKPIYESSCLLRVEPAGPDLFGLGTESEAFVHLLQTQVELIRSPSVISSAIAADPKLNDTALLRGVSDPEAELRGRLQVGVLPGTYLIRVALRTPKPEDGPVIIGAVVQKYRAVAIAWSNDKHALQIKRLEKYSDELWTRIKEKETEWIELARKPMADLQRAAPLSGDGSGLPVGGSKGVTIDEYRQIRQRLFDTNLKLIETEALLKKRQDELSARTAGADPELLAERRVQDALRNDPAVAELMKNIDALQRKAEAAKYRAGSPSDPSLVHLSRQLEDLKKDLRDLINRKREELVLQLPDEDPSLRALNDQIDSLKFLKSIYQKLLPQLRVSNAQEKADEVRLALLREDLASFREMRSAVEKRIEQLTFDSQGEARINEIDPARENRTPIKDARRKLFASAPVVVLALVLSLFLGVELLSGRGIDRDEIVPGA